MTNVFGLYQKQGENRRNGLREKWSVFKEPPLHPLIAEVIDRCDTNLPGWYMPWAPGIVTPSDYLLTAAGYRPGMSAPKGWKETDDEVYRRNWHTVRSCGELWAVERATELALSFPFGPVPMFARAREAAMCLAEYYPNIPDHCREAPCLTWAVYTPNGIFCVHGTRRGLEDTNDNTLPSNNPKPDYKKVAA